MLIYPFSQNWSWNAMQYQQNSRHFLFEIDKFILKLIWKFKVYRLVKTIFKKKKRFGGSLMSDYKAYCLAIASRTVRKNKDHWAQSNCTSMWQLISDQFNKSFQWGKIKRFFKEIVLEQLNIFMEENKRTKIVKTNSCFT